MASHIHAEDIGNGLPVVVGRVLALLCGSRTVCLNGCRLRGDGLNLCSFVRVGDEIVCCPLNPVLSPGIPSEWNGMEWNDMRWYEMVQYGM